MRSGMMGGMAACCLLVVSLALVGAGVSVFVNDDPVVFVSSPMDESGSVLVPLEEFAPQLGIAVERSSDAREVVLRWSGRRAVLDVSRFLERESVLYAWLEWLVGLVDGAVHRVGQAVYVEVDRARLLEIEADGDRVILRFDRFAPDRMSEAGAGPELGLSFYCSETTLAPQRILLGGGDFESVHLPAAVDGILALTIRYASPSASRVIRREVSGAYTVTLNASEFEESDTIIAIRSGVTLHELRRESEDGALVADLVEIDGWRTTYRLLPAYPATGFGTGECVDSIAREVEADLAIGLVPYGESLSLLMINGVPLAVSEAEHSVLAIDFFGRWEVLDSSLAVCAEHAGTTIAIDDVNRPIDYGEAIAYTPGYSGTLVRGIPGSFRVIKIRDSRVVSVYEGPFVADDKTATLIVASGEAKARFSLIELGDPIKVGGVWSAGDRTIVHAFDSGPLLLKDGIRVSDVPQDVGRCAALATDWHGGMTWLALSCTGMEAEDLTGAVLEVLEGLEVPLRNVVLLRSDRTSSLAIRNAYDFDRLGPADPFAVALCLVPLNP